MRILLIEDSPTIVEYVRELLRGRAGVVFLEPARDGAEGIRAAADLDPDVILMDLELPEVHGLEAIRRIMADRPRPIVVLSAHLDDPESNYGYESLRAGAVEVLAKPRGLTEADIEIFRRRLYQVLETVGMVRLRARTSATEPPPQAAQKEILKLTPSARRVVTMGSSTGGLPVVYEILAALPSPYPLPIVLAHHIVAGFEDGVTGWLSRTGHVIEVLHSGRHLGPGVVYLLPGDRALGACKGSVSLVPIQEDSDEGIDTTFLSLCEAYGGATVAILLTGMGEDGARGLRALADKGALTVAQRADSCLVNGMPDAARRLGACRLSLSPASISLLLQHLAGA